MITHCLSLAGDIAAQTEIARRVFIISRSSGQTARAPQAPFGKQASDRDQEIKRLMPQWGRPRFGNRSATRRETGDERGQAFAVDEFTVRLGGDRLQVFAVGLKMRELVGRGLGGPAGLARA